MDHVIEVKDWNDCRWVRNNAYTKYNVVFDNERLNKCPDNMIIYSLSTNSQIMGERTGPCTVMYDAICDIEVIDNNDIIESLSVEISDTYVESKKVNGRWDITKWFTLNKPLLNCAMYFSDPHLIIKFKITEKEKDTEKEKEITITWKAFRYLWDRRVYLMKKEFMRHGNFCILYIDGLARIVKLT